MYFSKVGQQTAVKTKMNSEDFESQLEQSREYLKNIREFLLRLVLRWWQSENFHLGSSRLTVKIDHFLFKADRCVSHSTQKRFKCSRRHSGGSLAPKVFWSAGWIWNMSDVPVKMDVHRKTCKSTGKMFWEYYWKYGEKWNLSRCLVNCLRNPKLLYVY